MVSSRNIAYALGVAVLVALTGVAFATSDSQQGKKDAAATASASSSSGGAHSTSPSGYDSGTGSGVAPTVGSPGSTVSGATATGAPSKGPAGHGAAGQSGGASSSQAETVALTKAAFVAQMNPLCAEVVKQVQALPVPTNPHSYADIQANADGTASLINAFFPIATQLVQHTADRDQLVQSWLTPFKADFDARRALIKDLATAALAHDDATVQSIGTQLDSLPNHRQDVLKYLTSYGLVDCVSLIAY